jgi:hypothetical protein
MAGSALGAQIRMEVFGELENLPDYRYFGDPFRPRSADPKEVFAN